MSAFTNYDQWLTTDHSLDYEPPPHPKCGHCGAFVSLRPDRVENREDILECDGTVKVSVHHYDERTVAILGDEYEGKTYEQPYSDCGIDTVPHEPHAEVMYAWAVEYRHCRHCGHEDLRSEA